MCLWVNEGVLLGLHLHAMLPLTVHGELEDHLGWPSRVLEWRAGLAGPPILCHNKGAWWPEGRWWQSAHLTFLRQLGASGRQVAGEALRMHFGLGGGCSVNSSVPYMK